MNRTMVLCLLLTSCSSPMLAPVPTLSLGIFVSEDGVQGFRYPCADPLPSTITADRDTACRSLVEAALGQRSYCMDGWVIDRVEPPRYGMELYVGHCKRRPASAS